MRARGLIGRPQRQIVMLRAVALFCFVVSLIASATHALFAQPIETRRSVSAMKPELVELATLIRDYRRALEDSDTAYLSKHTTFPMSIAEADLDMEAKPVARRLESVADLLRAREVLMWPQALEPDNPEALASLKRGAEKCSDPVHPDVPDWKKGNQAFRVSGDSATLTYLAAPCEATTHRVVLRFRRDAGVWRLHERTLQLGP